MDPLTMALGAGISGLSSLIGGAMNSSSAAAINTANLNNSMFMANNAVSMRVADANRAGINPLAALGVATPSSVVSNPTNPGSGLAAAGRSVGDLVSRVKDPHTEKMEQLQERSGQYDLERMAMQLTNAQLQIRQQMHVLEALESGNYRPSGVEPVGGPTAETARWGLDVIKRGWNTASNVVKGMGAPSWATDPNVMLYPFNNPENVSGVGGR